MLAIEKKESTVSHAQKEEANSQAAASIMRRAAADDAPPFQRTSDTVSYTKRQLAAHSPCLSTVCACMRALSQRRQNVEASDS